jgi:hypothetical protein
LPQIAEESWQVHFSRPAIRSNERLIAVSSFDPSTPARRSRRLAAWLAFGAVGLATGAVWASGFASISAGNGATAGSPAVTKTAPTTATSALNGTIDDESALAFDWNGRWGSIAADTLMFTVDLSGADYNGKTYNVALLLANTSVLTGWASLQLEVERVAIAAAGTCDANDFDGNTNARILNFDDEDAGVYWNGLAGDAVYCLGVAASPGDDVAGTFLRSAQDTPPSAFPTFIATVDRAS